MFEAILIFGEAGRNFHLAARVFNNKFSENSISRSSLRKVLNKLQATGMLNDAPISFRREKDGNCCSILRSTCPKSPKNALFYPHFLTKIIKIVGWIFMSG